MKVPLPRYEHKPGEVHYGSSIGDLIAAELQDPKPEGGALKTQVGGDHYKSCGIQPIEFIYANDLSYCEANIVKYATRHARKGGAEDVKKVIHYAELLLELEYGEK